STAALQPALGTPQLKLPDALGGLDPTTTPGKSDKPATPATPAPTNSGTPPSSSTAAQPVTTKDAPADRHDDGSKSSDDQAKSAVAAAAAATDKPADTS